MKILYYIIKNIFTILDKLNIIKRIDRKLYGHCYYNLSSPNDEMSNVERKLLAMVYGEKLKCTWRRPDYAYGIFVDRDSGERHTLYELSEQGIYIK